MFVIIGYVLVFASVIGGFLMAGGHVAALIQPAELVIIGGAAVGAFVVSNSPKTIKAVFRGMPGIFKGSKFTKQLYIDLLSMLYDMLSKCRKEGLMSIETDIDAPNDSKLFAKHPTILADHHAMEFVCDYMRLLVGGSMNAMQVENLMDIEIETHHHEAEQVPHAIARLADGLPAFGIVAAVMGVVHTMESVGLPPAELGKLIAAALVGTFIGILLSYGLVSPIAALLTHKAEESTKMLQCIKVVLLANMHNYPPQVAVEFGRKVLYSTERPDFKELEDAIRNQKAQAPG